MNQITQLVAIDFLMRHLSIPMVSNVTYAVPLTSCFRLVETVLPQTGSFEKLFKKQSQPNHIITDKLRTYFAALHNIGSLILHDMQRCHNHLAEVSHELTRQKKRLSFGHRRQVPIS